MLEAQPRPWAAARCGNLPLGGAPGEVRGVPPADRADERIYEHLAQRVQASVGPAAAPVPGPA
eukprot:5541600-Alexandrium_andersonii.AAC.1